MSLRPLTDVERAQLDALRERLTARHEGNVAARAAAARRRAIRRTLMAVAEGVAIGVCIAGGVLAIASAAGWL